MILSADQQSAIRREGQDVSVVAGPGSGKTTVLIERYPARIPAINRVEWIDRHVAISALTEISESCTPSMLDEMTAAARSIALNARASTLAKCEWCDYRDIFRIEVSR